MMEDLVSKIWSYITNAAIGVIGLVIVSELVMPNRNTARMIESINQGFVTMVNVAMASRAIEERDAPLAWEYIYKMSSDEQLELLTDLTDDDFDWLSRMSENL
jgi:hypothetical protein